VLWTPVARSDIAWNFEKFLIGPDGKVVQRYSRYFEIGGIESDIDALL
jgi:glutathione peroxidase